MSDRQRRFLAEYQRYPVVAPSARLAGVHRATVYRWKFDPVFAAAMRAAGDAWSSRLRQTVVNQEADRQRWREERERARHPQRCATLARLRYPYNGGSEE